jgi:hypothetical protein
MVMRERLNWGGVAFLVIMGGSAALFVSGCATGMEAVTGPPKPAPAPIVANVVQCPTIHAFTPAQNVALGAALDGISARAKAGAPAADDAIWHDVAEDDQKQRAQARACIAAQKK